MLNNSFHNIIYNLSKEISEYLIKFKINSENIEQKWVDNHLKTNIDLIINEMWSKNLRRYFPDIQIISEETKNDLKKIPNYWTGFIVDPIDGTRSYVEGFNGYVSQLAFVQNGQIEYSLIAIPEKKQIYTFFKNKILINNQILKKKDIVKKKNFIIIDNYPKPSKFIKRLMNYLEVYKYIVSGSIGLKLLKISNNEADLVIKPINAKIWDISPAIPLLNYNNYYVFNFDGDKFSNNINHCSFDIKGIVASNNLELANKTINWIKSNKINI